MGRGFHHYIRPHEYGNRWTVYYSTYARIEKGVFAHTTGGLPEQLEHYDAARLHCMAEACAVGFWQLFRVFASESRNVRMCVDHCWILLSGLDHIWARDIWYIFIYTSTDHRWEMKTDILQCVAQHTHTHTHPFHCGIYHIGRDDLALLHWIACCCCFFFIVLYADMRAWLSSKFMAGFEYLIERDSCSRFYIWISFHGWLSEKCWIWFMVLRWHICWRADHARANTSTEDSMTAMMSCFGAIPPSQICIPFVPTVPSVVIGAYEREPSNTIRESREKNKPWTEQKKIVHTTTQNG